MIEWGVASRALPGETRSGDLHVVESFAGGALVAAVDGLGHGEEAADAAEAAAAILSRHAHEPVAPLVQRCHESLRATRGVVMSVASFVQIDDTMSWLGIGNVEASLFRSDPGSPSPRESLPLRGGVVGYRLPRLFPSVLSVSAGDTLIFATDGIDGGYFKGLRLFDPPAMIAQSILTRFGRSTDDALTLVVRYRGEIS